MRKEPQSGHTVLTASPHLHPTLPLSILHTSLSFSFSSMLLNRSCVVEFLFTALTFVCRHLPHRPKQIHIVTNKTRRPPSCRRRRTHTNKHCVFSLEAGCSPDRKIFSHVTDTVWELKKHYILYIQAVFMSWWGKRMWKFYLKRQKSTFWNMMGQELSLERDIMRWNRDWERKKRTISNVLWW